MLKLQRGVGSDVHASRLNGRPRAALSFHLSKYQGFSRAAYSTQEHAAPGVFSQ